MAILAIDQGTTSTRGLRIDNSGTGTIVKALEHRQLYPRPGWVEHDPEELIAHILCCIECCDNLTAIGIDNQGESCLAWNRETGEAVTPVIVWQDTRTQPVIDRLKAEGAQELVLDRAGLPLDAYFSAAKLGWIVAHVPEAEKLLRQGKLGLGTTDAFFLNRLTGQFVTDISTASRTSLMNLQSGQWDQKLCDLFAVPMEALPEIMPSTGDFGAVRTDGRYIPVTACVVDQQAALYGHGCRNTGDTKITFGTGAFALVVTGNMPCQASDKGLLPTVAWQLKGQRPVYALDGGVLSAGSAVNWARSLGLFRDYEQIQQFSQKRGSAIKRDLAFVPALSGLGCPHWDRKAGGLWIGLSLDTHPMDLMQSILEGIAFRAAEVIAAMNMLVPVADEISIDGGLAANPYFCQFLADVLDLQITVQSSAELTALGTAQLAAGKSFAPDTQETSMQRYPPQNDRRQDLEKFKEAVQRAEQWHS